MLTRFLRPISGKGLFAITVWGASFAVVRIALETLNPLSLVTFRFAAGAALLYFILRIRGGHLMPRRSDLRVCTLLGCILGAHLLVQSYGLQYTSAVNTGWIIGFIPVTLAIGAHVLHRQRITGIGWLGVLAGAVGVGLVTVKSPPDFKNARFGDLLQLTSCFTWTVYTLVGSGPASRNGALRVTAFAMGLAALIVAVPTTTTGVFRQAPTVEAVVALAFLGLVCSGVAYFLWFQAVMEHGPARVGSLIYLEPFVSLAVATSMLREPVTGNALAGGLCVLIGVWLITRGTSAAAPAAYADRRCATRPTNGHELRREA